MKLTAHPSNAQFAKRIKVNIECSNVATIFCDGCVQFADHHDFTPQQLKQITFIAEHFGLFFNNINSSNA
jgi:hypothetical protein